MYNFIKNKADCIDFAVFPYINHPLREFSRGAVRLQVGNAKWGLKHIELAHAHEIKRLKLAPAAFVSSIVKPGSPIYCEFDTIRDSQRAQTVNVRIGTVVLEYKITRAECFYTIITAFSRRQPVGELIGRLE
jgi:hypothetical protein